MVQPRLVQSNIQTNDVTRQFRAAASRLPPGKLIKDEHFTLFEAVSALEIGDPKMDSGCAAFDPANEEQFDVFKDISAEQCVWLMDELTYREVAWHMGYPLSQTLFTSIYIERLLSPEPKQLEEACFYRAERRPDAASLLQKFFRPYCIGLIKCCDLVRSMIISQHYYEEEDFASQIFNRPLLHNIPIEQVTALLEEAHSWLRSKALPAALATALGDRLENRLSLLHLFQHCALGSRPSVQKLDRDLALLDRMEHSSILGHPTNTTAFTLKIQRRLASSVPPRPMIAIQKQKAFTFLRQLLTDIGAAFHALDTTCSNDLLTAYQNLMAQSVQPAVYVRALVQSFLNLNNMVLGRFSVRDLVSQDIRSLVLPRAGLLGGTGHADEIREDQESQLAAHLENFIARSGQSFLNLYRAFCLNRCRVRRTLCHAVLEWDQIQAEAEDLDTLTQSILNEQPLFYPDLDEPTFSYSFSSWVYHHKLEQLRVLVQMGFELSIYAAHEFANMYWYLSFVTSTHISHLERISSFVSSNKQGNTVQRNEVQTTLRRLYRRFTWLKATEAAAKALHRVFTVLQRHGHLTKPSSVYTSEVLSYELRMRPFLHLSIPEPVGLEVARQSLSLSEFSDQALLEQALGFNQTARKGWEEVLREGWNIMPLLESGSSEMGHSPGSSVEKEWTKNVRDSMRASIGTGLAISALSRALQGRGAEAGISRLKVTIPSQGQGDRWHPSWPVPKLAT